MADDNPEQSESGSPIYRHKPREKPFELTHGDPVALEQISRHIERFVGPIKNVFHELVSDLVHIDIHVVEPTKKRPFYTLITSGMSDKPMTVPEGLEAMSHAELCLCLPPDWPLDQKSFEDENNYWPLRWLKMLARMPHEYDTWLCDGHTVPNGDPPEPFADETKFCGMMLAPPLSFGEKFANLCVHDDKVIHFWSVLPLYREEMDLKLRKGAEVLLDKFDKHGVTELIEVGRKNVAKKFLGLF